MKKELPQTHLEFPDAEIIVNFRKAETALLNEIGYNKTRHGDVVVELRTNEYWFIKNKAVYTALSVKDLDDDRSNRVELDLYENEGAIYSGERYVGVVIDLKDQGIILAVFDGFKRVEK